MAISRTVILIVSIFTLAAVIFSIVVFNSISSQLDVSLLDDANKSHEQNWNDMDKFSNNVEKISTNPFYLLLHLIQPLGYIAWIFLFISIPLAAKAKGKSMPLWGAFSFFLAPIAGIVFYFITKENVTAILDSNLPKK